MTTLFGDATGTTAAVKEMRANNDSVALRGHEDRNSRSAVRDNKLTKLMTSDSAYTNNDNGGLPLLEFLFIDL